MLDRDFLPPRRPLDGWRARWAVLALLICATLHMGDVFAGTAKSPSCNRPSEAIRIDAHLQVMQIGRHFATLEDPTGQQTLDDVLAACRAWQSPTHFAIQNGLSRSTWWVHMRIQNDASANRHVYLDTQDNLQDYLDAYVLDGSGKVLHRWSTGDRRPFGQRPVASNTVVLPLEIRAGAYVDVVIRLATYDGLHEVITPVLRSEDNFVQHAQQRSTINALYVGVVAALILYNAFMYLGAGVPMVGLYALYALTFLSWSMSFYGMSFQYLWPDHPDFNNYWIALSACMAHCVGFYFFSRYIGRAAPGTERVGNRANAIFSVLLFIPTILALAGKYAATFVVLIPVDFLMITFVFYWAYAQWRHGNGNGKYVLLAFTALGAGVVLYFTRVLGVCEANVINENGIQIGSVLEVLFVAFGVADHLNSLQKARLDAERQANLAQKALNEDLDRLVKERTLSLEVANRQLQSLNMTDALTKICNRRHFDETLQQQLAQRRDDNGSLILSIFDIDYFKWINDHLGHQAGDEVLIAIARTAHEIASLHGAKAFRIGGEEFAILFPGGADPVESVEAVEELRQAIVGLDRPHGGSPHGKVTASFGVIAYSTGCSHSDRTTEHPCAQADRLLYAAKHAGRNRVHSEIFSKDVSRAPDGHQSPTSDCRMMVTTVVA